jgi:hypothetical protein
MAAYLDLQPSCDSAIAACPIAGPFALVEPCLKCSHWQALVFLPSSLWNRLRWHFLLASRLAGKGGPARHRRTSRSAFIAPELETDPDTRGPPPAGGSALGAIMVREGFAWAFTRFSVDYEARTANRGVHAHDCVPAWEWWAQQRARNGQ